MEAVQQATKFEFIINLKTNQVRRKLGSTLELLLRESVLDGEIFSFIPSKPTQLLPERVHEDRAAGSITWVQVSDAEDFPRLLRVGCRARSKEQGA